MFKIDSDHEKYKIKHSVKYIKKRFVYELELKHGHEPNKLNFPNIESFHGRWSSRA